MQHPDYTIGAVKCAQTSLHNSCMAKKDKPPDPLAILAGKRIADARKKRGWTQKELARETGWTTAKPSQAQPEALAPSRVANFEQGTRRVGFEEAKILEKIFGAPAPYFMGVVTDQEALLLAALRKSNTFPARAVPGAPTVEAPN